MTIKVTPKEIADLIEILLDRQTSISVKELTEILNRQAVEECRKRAEIAPVQGGLYLEKEPDKEESKRKEQKGD